MTPTVHPSFTYYLSNGILVPTREGLVQLLTQIPRS